MEYYLVITNAEGESRIVPISDVSEIPVDPGDDVVVMDGDGNPVDVSLRPDEDDLVLSFPTGETARLLDFYETGEDDDPVTISLNPTLPEDAGYEFNSQTGNLPDGMGFSLMRFSNTEYIQFVEQIDELAVGTLLAGLSGGNAGVGGGGGGGGDPTALPEIDIPEREDLILDPVPKARADVGIGLEDGAPIVVDLLKNDIDARGDGLVIHSVGGIDVEAGRKVTLSTGTVITVNTDGTVSVEPGEEFDYLQVGESATETFVYTIRDAGGNLDTSRATVTILGVNDPPEANPDLYSLSEDAPVTVEVLENDTDADASDTLTVTGISTPSAGVATLNGDNSVTFDPNGEFEYLGVGETATVAIDYTISDDSGATATSTATFLVEGVNDAPDAIDDIASTGENSAVTIDVLDNDTDPDSTDSLTITGITQPNTGSATYNAGDLAFDPGSDFDYLGDGESATVTFSYDISDGNGGTDTATVTVTVTGTDDATVTNPDAGETDEDSPVTIDVLANDDDVDDTLTVASVDGSGLPGDASVTNNGTDVTFNPGTAFNDLAAGETEIVTFTYTTNTGATETVTVTVNGTNDAPTAVADDRTTDQDTPLVIDAVANDLDPDTSDNLIIIGVDQPTSGSVSINASNQLVFEPGDDFDALDETQSATVTFDYTISDGNGGTDTATVTVTVNGTDDATVINPDAGKTDEDSSVTIDVLANDSDVDDALTVASVDDSGLPGDASVTNNGTDVTFNPGTAFNDLAAGETEIVTFTYTTNTGATETVTVTVTGTNDGPVAVNDTDAVDEDATLVVSAADGVIQGPGTDTDADASDTLTVVAVENSSNVGALVGNPLVGVYGTLTLNDDGSYTYAADQDAADPLAMGETVNDVFTYTVSDGNSGTDTATLTITVTGTNDVPVANPPGGRPGVDPGVYDDTDTIAEDDGAPASGNVLANDVDLDESNVLIVSEVNGSAANVANSISGTFGDITIDADGSYDYFLNNGDATVQALAVGETLTETFTYTADDQNGGTATASLTITITGTNDVPIANPPGGAAGVDPGVYDDTDSIDEDAFPNTTDGNVLANDLDPDGDPLTVATVNGSTANVGSQITGSYGAVTIGRDGRYQYVLDNGNAAVNGLDDGETLTETFTYTADDGNGGTATASLTITINGTDDATVINPDAGQTDEDTSVTIDVLANDSDADDTLTVASVDDSGLPGDASVTNNTTDVTFNPGTAFNDLARGETEIVAFTYTTNTGSTETVTVTVTGTNDAPTAVADDRTTDQNTPLVIDAVANDLDPDTSDNLLIIGVDQPSSGSVSINASNQLVFDPGDDFDALDETQSATVTFDYTISDGNGGTDTAAVTVTVNGTDDATVINPDDGETDEDTSVTIDVLANDSDVDDTLTVASVDDSSLPGDASVTNNTTNVTFNPGTAFNDLARGETEIVTFTYTTNTGATETVTVTVNGTNDAPTAVNDTESTDQASVVNIDLLGAADSVAADSDPDGDALTVTQINGVTAGGTITLASGALVTVNGNGTVDYDPNGQFSSLDQDESLTDSFTYTISDGNGGTATATATVTISGLDDALVASPDSATTGENTSVTIEVLANDSDPDTTDNPLSIDSFDSTTSGGGTVSQVGDDLVFDPGTDFDALAAGETEVVTFDYTVTNQDGATATETVTVTVMGANDAPTAIDDSESVTQNGSTNIDLLGAGDSVAADSDPDGDTLSIAVVDGKTAGGTIGLTSGALLTMNADGTADYNPNGAFDYLDLGESAVDTFVYQVSDGNGGTDTATVTVTVTGADDVMTTVNDRASTSENSPVTIDVLANDDDPDTTDKPLSVLSVSQPAMGSVTNNGNDVTFDPETDFDYLAGGESATVTFSYTAVNQDGATAVESVTVTVNGENDGPDTHADTLHTIEGTGRSLDVIQNDFDPDSPQLTITAIDGVAVTANQPVSLSSGAIVTVMEDGRVYFNPNGVYTPLGFGETATETFTYTVTDSEGATASENVSVIIDGVDNEIPYSGAYQVLSDQLYEIQLDPIDESIVYVPIGDPLPFNFNSIAFNSNDGLIYANATESDAGSGTTAGDIIQIDPFTGRVVANLGQLLNDQGESIPNFAGAINSDLGVNGIWYVNGVGDSSGNTTYAVDLATMTVTGIGSLPGADYGVDVTTGLLWSVQGNNSYSLDPTSGVLTTYTHGGLQNDGMSAANGTFGSMFADGDGNIQVTSNSGYGLYRLDTSDGSLTRVTDAPATSSNDATGTFVSTLPSASPFLFLDADGSTLSATNQDAVRNYDPTGGPVSIADSDTAIADLDGNTIASARIVLTNTLTNDLLTINGPLPGGITGTVSMQGGFLVATLTGNASQQDYADAIEAVTFSNTSVGSVPSDVRAIDVTVTDIDGVRSNTATSLIFIGAGTGVISGRAGQNQDDAYADSLVVMEDDNDPSSGGARLNLLRNDSDDPITITGVSQPPAGEGTVTNNGDGTATFNPGDDFHYLSEGETAITSFTYSTNTGKSETVTVTVHGINDPLEATPDSGYTDADSPVTIDVLANDEDLDTADNPLTLNAVTQPAGGSVSIIDNKAVFDPGNDFDSLAGGETATVTFIYTVTNAEGIDENETVTVTVVGVNGGPNAADDMDRTGERSPVTISVLNNDSDPDSDTLTVTGVSQPNNGSVTYRTGDVTFDPGSDFDSLAEGETAIETFTYEISDGNGGTDTATVTITVEGENDLPVASADLVNTDRNEAVTFSPLENDRDFDGDPLVVSQIDGTNVNPGDTVTLSSGAQVTLNPAGTFTYDANGNYDSIRAGDLLGEDFFTYQVSDGNGGFAIATATVVLTPQLLLANGALGYATPDTAAELYTFIPDTSTVPTAETKALSQVFDGEGMTMRPSTGMVIVFDRDTAGDLYHIDPNTGSSTFIGTTGITEIQGASFFVDSTTLEETLYVVGNGGGDGGTDIFIVDPDTGVVDSNGFGTGVDRLALYGDISALSSLTVDPATGLGWGTDDNSSSSTFDGSTNNPDLYTVDLTTGETTFVAGLPSGIDGESLAFAVDGKLYTESEGSPKTIYEVDKVTGALTPAAEWNGSGDVEGMAFNAFFNLFSPAVDLDSTAAGDGYTGVYSGNPTSITSFNSDLDSERTHEVLMATITLTNPQEGDQLNIGALPTTIIGGQTTDGAGQLVVTLYVNNGNTGTIADFEAAIEAITFDNSLTSPDSMDRIIEVRIMDTDGTLSEPAVSTLEIATTPPIVIDMDGDGVEFDNIEDGIAFDADGDGELEQMAWADEDDAVLIYDQNDNNDVDGLDEFAFARYSDDPNATDLEGLRHFDTNEDLILDANDAEFDSFKLWQDRDGDGTVDEGEIISLREAGIESLELTSDGNSYEAADGDVFVHGEAGVNYSDGTKGTLADAEFEYEELAVEDHPIEVITNGGDVLNLSDSEVDLGEASPDLVDPAPDSAEGDSTAAGNEGGAMSPTSMEDDMAAADSTMA